MPRLAPLAALLVVSAPLAAQPPADSAAFASAAIAWERGEYPAALRALLELVQAPAGGRQREAVALLTGERYHTDSLAADGRALRLSADGRYAAWEVGAAPGVATQIVRIQPAGVRLVATLPGTGVALAPTGNLAAYLQLPDDAALRELRAQSARLGVAGDREGARAALLRAADREAVGARVVIRDLASGKEAAVAAPGLAKRALAFSPDRATLYFLGRDSAGTDTLVYAWRGAGRRAEPLARTRVSGTELTVAPGGRHLVVSGAATGASPAFFVVDAASGAVRTVPGIQPSVAADGSAIAYVVREAREQSIRVVRLSAVGARLSATAAGRAPSAESGEPLIVKRTTDSLETPVLSPDGRRVAFGAMPAHDWELFVAGATGDSVGEVRLTREIQHDRLPRWLNDSTVLAVRGEPRHRRSYLYDAATGRATRLFHNNTVRTIAPEYEWVPTTDGARVLVVAERDGDTVSPERSVYAVDLRREVTPAELQQRLRAQLAGEEALRERGARMFAPVRDLVRQLADSVSIERLYGYQKALFDFGSKHITRPGNLPARHYLFDRYRSFGYAPVFQEFEPRGAARTANVVATLRGTENPELVYVVGSHFDSRAEGPGADDNTSGTAVLLETARVLARTPLPATVVFVSFTGEEAGLLGSREFARQAVAQGWKVVGALNNDMLGWSNDQRLDNTIRYANPGIRDVQHAAALGFSRLVTYDAVYYKNTDAHALYEAWGDVIGGIGSYPVLGNPHYHQPHDVLETINQELVAETARANVAAIALLASSPSRVTGLAVASRTGTAAELRWNASPEKGVTGYRVAHGPAGDPLRTVTTVSEPAARLASVPAGTVVSVKAVNARGLEGWDWARVVVK